MAGDAGPRLHRTQGRLPVQQLLETPNWLAVLLADHLNIGDQTGLREILFLWLEDRQHEFLGLGDDTVLYRYGVYISFYPPGTAFVSDPVDGQNLLCITSRPLRFGLRARCTVHGALTAPHRTASSCLAMEKRGLNSCECLERSSYFMGHGCYTALCKYGA